MMNKDQKRKKAEELAFEFEREYGGCAQCVVGAIKEVYGFVDNEVFKSASGLAGGLGLSGDVCGALLGGAMVLSVRYGRTFDNFEDSDKVRYVSYKMVKKLREQFLNEFGSTKCQDIQRKLMGRSYNLWDEKEMEIFEAHGGHEDKCPSVCKKATEWVIKLLEEEDLL